MRVARYAIILTLGICVTANAPASAQDLKPILLPAPQTEIGKPLMQALKLRQSSREFSTRTLPVQELSNLLWAAWGINREDRDMHTAPSASNRQEMDVYVVMEKGVYCYDPRANSLEPVKAGDIRAATGTQDFVATAPLNLVYVADLSKMGSRSREGNIITASADAGFISQNVYLYCASQGLATVVRGLVDREECAKAMGLRPDQYVTYGQTVGYGK